MTTQFLLERHYEMVPRFRQRLEDAEAMLKDANADRAHLRQIAAGRGDRCADDPAEAGEGVPEPDQPSGRGADSEIERMHRRFAKATSQIDRA